MNRLARGLCLACALCSVVSFAEEQPEDNQCAMCHGLAELWEGESAHLHVSAESLRKDVHWQRGLRCHDCHGGNPQTLEPREAHAAEDGFRKISTPRDLVPFCGRCHSDLDYMRRYVPGIQSDTVAEFQQSAHGRFLAAQPGDERAPSCNSCHLPHAASSASDPASSTSPARVASTCAPCHPSIAERLRGSVHAQPTSAEGGDTRGGKAPRRPSCTDCHPGHDPRDPKSTVVRNQQPFRCGVCHAEMSTRYALSMHGELTELGYGPAAKCSDCHGAHAIRRVADAASTLSPAKRLATCRKCHADVTPGLLTFDPHADHRDRARSPTLFWTYAGLLAFISSLFLAFGLHSCLWFARGSLEVLRRGRAKWPRANETAFIRFRPFHRLAHAVLVVSFLGLALTGLPLKFSQREWARQLADGLGGFGATGWLHRVFSLAMFGCLLTYAVLLLRHYRAGRRRGLARREVLFGPDSPLPNPRDWRDFRAMARWFLGRGPKPVFDRWAYWEKVDFWGACSDVMLIGATGLLLWFPGFFCRYLPGEAVNVAKVVHSTLALLATGFVFAIHFFSTHFRPDKFPMDMSVLTGFVSEEEMVYERRDYLERLRREGRVEQVTARGPTRRLLWTTWVLGMVALWIGLGLLVAVLCAAFV